MDVPVQYFRSVIAIELAVAGALLWQVRFFESSSTAQHREHLPDARPRLLLALVVGATLFGSLWAMANEGDSLAPISVTIGLAVSLLPILLRVLPPLARDARLESSARSAEPASGPAALCARRGVLLRALVLVA